MAAPKGTRPPNAGKGRKAGTPNKLTADVKGMILGALEAAGGREYLLAQSKAEPAAFMALVGKLLPKQVELEATLRQCDVSADPLPMDEWDRRYGVNGAASVD